MPVNLIPIPFLMNHVADVKKQLLNLKFNFFLDIV